MSPVPKNPKVYHITHIDNLTSLADDVLWSDAERIRRKLKCTVVGMSEIKRRRLEELEVDCHAGTKVGNYVPFYFCPRSIMLYLLHMGNAPGVTYQGGQQPIIHLQADLSRVLKWAEDEGRRWAFTNINAGAYYARFFDDPAQLDRLDWKAIAATDWRDPDAKEGKQAEFLLEEYFPWELVELIGVINAAVAKQVEDLIEQADHQPTVVVRPEWYY
jgi:ssDNA thymidine ADP-ribosyltransferase, DarT